MAAFKGICSVCGENTSLRKDGFVRAHGYLKQAGQTVPCAGTDQEPRTTSDGAFSALCEKDGCESSTAAIVWFEGTWRSLCGTHGKRALKGVS